MCFKPNPHEADNEVSYTHVDIPQPAPSLFHLDEDEIVCCFYYPMLEWLYKNHTVYAENADRHFQLIGMLPDPMSDICSEITTDRMYRLSVSCLMEGVRHFLDGLMQRPQHNFSRDVQMKLDKMDCLAAQLHQPQLHLTAEAAQMVRKIERRSLFMESMVARTAYYVGYSYMESTNRLYWQYPQNDYLAQAVKAWFTDALK